MVVSAGDEGENAQVAVPLNPETTPCVAYSILPHTTTIGEEGIYELDDGEVAIDSNAA